LFAEARDWFDDQSPATAGRKLLGCVLLGHAFWRLEATAGGMPIPRRKAAEKEYGDA
jgi:hypothetical protein